MCLILLFQSRYYLFRLLLLTVAHPQGGLLTVCKLISSWLEGTQQMQVLHRGVQQQSLSLGCSGVCVSVRAGTCGDCCFLETEVNEGVLSSSIWEKFIEEEWRTSQREENGRKSPEVALRKGSNFWCKGSFNVEKGSTTEKKTLSFSHFWDNFMLYVVPAWNWNFPIFNLSSWDHDLT